MLRIKLETSRTQTSNKWDMHMLRIKLKTSHIESENHITRSNAR